MENVKAFGFNLQTVIISLLLIQLLNNRSGLNVSFLQEVGMPFGGENGDQEEGG